MNILYIHQYFKFPDERGGTRSYDLATQFVKKGIGVTIVTTTSNEKYSHNRWTLIEKDGLKVHYLYLPYDNSFSYIKRIIVFIKFIFFSSLKILNIKCDLVLATSTPLTIGVPVLIKKWLRNTKFIFEVRDVWPEAVIAIGAIKSGFLKKVLFFLEKTIYKNASAIVPLSTDMQRSIVERYPEVKEKTSVVIENISEINRFSQVDSSDVISDNIGFKPRFSVLYAGTFGKVNGVHKFVELAKHMVDIDESIIFILIGEGVEKKSVEKLAKVNGVLGKNLFILPSVSKSELPYWYKNVSMGASFVIDIKELWANSANKFFDTLAAGKPILINHKGWQAECINQNNIGFVISNCITKEAVKSFYEYTLDVESYEKQCLNSLEVAEKKYSLNVAVDKYLKIFKNV